MGHPAPRAELLFDHDIGVEPAGDLEATFRQLGFATISRNRLPHRAADEITWLMLVALPLHAFLSGIGSAAVKDVYAKAKQLVPAHRKAKDTEDNRIPLVLQDSNTGLKIIFDADLPGEAIRQLVDLDLDAYPSGPLHYDQHRKKWRSELDEARS